MDCIDGKHTFAGMQMNRAEAFNLSISMINKSSIQEVDVPVEDTLFTSCLSTCSYSICILTRNTSLF